MTAQNRFARNHVLEWVKLLIRIKLHVQRRDMPSACFDANIHVFECVWHIGGLLMKHAKGMSLRYGVFAFCS